METRTGNIIVQTPGGSAAEGSYTYKVSLPSAWVKQMGLTPEDRAILLAFDGTHIRISKRQSFSAFVQARKGMHSLCLLDYYDRETLCTQIAADYTEQSVCIENLCFDIFKTAFGNNLTPSWQDYLDFLESRCIPRQRAGLREYLESLGLYEYVPLEIIKKTAGKMAEDQQWIRIEDVL